MLTPLDIEAAFLDAAAGRGLVIRHLVADGRLHRCDAEGRGGKGDGAYLLHLDGVPNGAFMDWRDGRGWEKWKADAAAVLTPAERAALKDKAERQRREREDQKLRHQAAAREQAIAMLDRSMPADEQHPYLARKRVKPSGIHQDGETLLIPTRDAAGWVRNLQRIWPDGTKRYLQGGPVTGCFLGIGGERGAPVCIAEGYATAATIREATGWPAAVAFDAGNLAPVALSLRSKCASARLVLAADDDWLTKGNPGLSKARNAAEAVGAALVLPASARTGRTVTPISTTWPRASGSRPSKRNSRGCDDELTAGTNALNQMTKGWEPHHEIEHRTTRTIGQKNRAGDEPGPWYA